jgi:hypothetical protein
MSHSRHPGTDRPTTPSSSLGNEINGRAVVEATHPMREMENALPRRPPPRSLRFVRLCIRSDAPRRCTPRADCRSAACTIADDPRSPSCHRPVPPQARPRRPPARDSSPYPPATRYARRARVSRVCNLRRTSPYPTDHPYMASGVRRIAYGTTSTRTCHATKKY